MSKYTLKYKENSSKCCANSKLYKAAYLRFSLYLFTNYLQIYHDAIPFCQFKKIIASAHLPGKAIVREGPFSDWICRGQASITRATPAINVANG